MGIKYPYFTAERKPLGFLFQLSSSCHEVACHNYAQELGTSLNQSIDPCENLYDFVCGGRRTSSVKAEAEERLYEQALTTALWSSATSAHRSVAGKIVDYLLSLNSDIEEGLALSVGLRVIQEIGWMAHKDIDIHLRDTAPYRFTRRCQHQVEQMVGVAWFSLLSLPEGDNGLIKRIQSALQEIGLPHGPAEGILKGPWDLPSLLLPVQRETFFGNWMAYTQLHWNLTKNRNIMRMNSYQDWTWKFNVTVTPLIFSFPFYHKDMPSAVNYAGAGRLLARELLRAAQGPAQLQLTTDTRSLLASLTAYRQESKTPRFSLGQPHGNTKDQLFFVASCYALCSADQNGAARRACNAPVKGLPDFRAAFQCFGT
ncbi:hypothetical protein IscW_ISCW015434 [Ixodes scapularis]|uniref:Uncharacterized protein n=1 Tax=Ixodes scapularis TaxID=6945 RepID=B7QN01_IXOSC|nr:hypothetical protein IscW_ISCW015434 [Ixodes scapularis]|eukprot:XP_002400467.1 hypothetical protein IscW_ISCW015434 [Ixodes scapularis]